MKNTPTFHFKLSLIAIIYGLFLLSGCATLSVNPSIKEESLLKINKIGVINLLDETFHGIHIGTTVFNNKYYEEDITDWKIGDSLLDFTNDYLSKNTEYKVTTIPLSVEERVALYKNKKNQSVNYNAVIELSKSKGLDTIVIFRSVRYDNEPFHKSPYGFFQRKMFNLNSRNIYSMFMMEVYSTETGKQIGWHWGFPYSPNETQIEWKPEFSLFTESEKQEIKESLISHIQASIKTALDKEFLNNKK